MHIHEGMHVHFFRSILFHLYGIFVFQGIGRMFTETPTNVSCFMSQNIIQLFSHVSYI